MLRLERIKNRAAVSITARELEAARAFIRQLQGPAAGAVMSRWGLEPLAPIRAATSTQ